MYVNEMVLYILTMSSFFLKYIFNLRLQVCTVLYVVCMYVYVCMHVCLCMYACMYVCINMTAFALQVNARLESIRREQDIAERG